MKDLTILLNGRRIEEMVIVDNKVESYASNLENGIPITDFLGQDVLSRVLHGGLSVLWMAVAATGLGVLLGLAVGMAAGYLGGMVDEILMWFSDVVMAFPQIVLAIVFVSMVGPQPWLIVIVVALSHVPRVARLVRSLTQGVARSEYVEAAEAIGMPTRRIAVREVLPNLITPLTVESTIRLAWSVAIVAALFWALRREISPALVAQGAWS